MRRVLFVAVHPDDETLGCGGTILKHRDGGDEIYWLIVTTIKNHPTGRWNLNEVQKREDTIKQVSEQYGFCKVFQLGYPTICLDKLDLGDLVNGFGKAIDEIKPDIIYMMFQNDVHSDHRVSFNALYGCLKSFRRPYIQRILMFEALSETEFAVATPQNAFLPNVYIDITQYMDKKLSIMQLYDTEVMETPYPRSLSSIKALARYRGSRAGVDYAESFMLLYEKI